MDGIFPHKLLKAPTPAEMRLWDEAAIAFGIPENMLMEAAGCRVFEFLRASFPSLADIPVCIFMGAGNNGGDGACVARHLRDAGVPVHVFHQKSVSAYKDACAWHTDLAQRDGVGFSRIPDEVSTSHFLEQYREAVGRQPGIILDALLGTGFTGALRPDMAKLIGIINELALLWKAFVLSVDIPSGLNGETGMPSPVAIKADVTLTLASPKTGLLMPQASDYRGKLIFRPIGLPRAISGKCPSRARVLDGRALLSPPAFPANSFKNIFGHVFVIGGRSGLAGAAHLASAGALRAGAGLVTACAPAASLPEIKANWPEIMTLSLSAGTDWPDSIPPQFAGALSRASAIVIGPGMGRGKDSQTFLEAFLKLENRPPTILDADALMLISQNPSLFEQLRPIDILTPHPGEAAALLNSQSAHVQAQRLEAISMLNSKAPSVFALKGACTLVGQKGKDLLISPYDIPQLAIGGAGDVLSGIIGAFAGMKRDALTAAGLGVVCHALAGLIRARQFPGRGTLASELANAVPEVPAFIARELSCRPDKGEIPWPC